MTHICWEWLSADMGHLRISAIFSLVNQQTAQLIND